MSVQAHFAFDQFLLIGDSITQHAFNPTTGGWALPLQYLYARKVDILNRGHSGFQSTWLRLILPSLLRSTLPALSTTSTSHPQPKILLATLFIGANDACLSHINSKYHVPLETYKENLRSMVKDLESAVDQKRIILITPPPVIDNKWGSHLAETGRPLDRGWETTLPYRVACLELASSLSLPCIDTWTLFLGEDFHTPIDQASLDQYLLDGLHLAPEGNRKLSEKVLEVIEQTWPEIVADRIDFVVPSHFDIDNVDLDRTLLKLK
ncbi:isoamyl acetate-hydrolyzing esterase [Rhizophlyctis rosea]|nr:isoamyl acetate-hydrolyzing esterase [Rhizophlyctis rosea]